MSETDRIGAGASAFVVVVFVVRPIVIGSIIFCCVIGLCPLVTIAESDDGEPGKAGDLEATGDAFEMRRKILLRLDDFVVFELLRWSRNRLSKHKRGRRT